MKKWSVYKHISPSGKVYVGISSNIERRWACSGYYYCLKETIFSRALRKYGWENFKHEIIKTDLSKEEASELEKELILYYKSNNISYNITDGGDGFCGKHTEEHIENIKKAHLNNSKYCYLIIDKNYNYIVCNTQKEAAEFLDGVQSNIAHVLNQPIGYTFKGYYIWKHQKSEEVDIDNIKNIIERELKIRRDKKALHTNKIHNKLKEGYKKYLSQLSGEEKRRIFGNRVRIGWNHTEETKRKIAEKAKGRDTSKAWKVSCEKRKKSVIQLDKNGIVINTFSSATEAGEFLNIGKSQIPLCAKGKRKSAGNYLWKYKE